MCMTKRWLSIGIQQTRSRSRLSAWNWKWLYNAPNPAAAQYLKSIRSKLHRRSFVGFHNSGKNITIRGFNMVSLDTDGPEPTQYSIELRHGIYMMLGTILFFHMVNWILKSRVPPDSLKDDEWKWRNLYVSWIHAVVVSVWTILSMFLYPELFQDPMLHVNYFTYFNVCLPTGYFVYDFLDMLLHGKVLTFWEVTLHHKWYHICR